MEFQSVETTKIDEKRMPKEPGAVNGGMIMGQDPLKCLIITLLDEIDEVMERVMRHGG
jgi:hypothetical protein